MTEGVDSVSYWNVWRLTPEVYRPGREAAWIVKNDFQKFESDGIADRAEYVLVTTTDILLTVHHRHSLARSPDYRRYYLTPKLEGVPVYTKASKSSVVQQTTPPGVRKLFCDYSVPGLDGSGTYCHVSHWEEDVRLSGFVHEENIDS